MYKSAYPLHDGDYEYLDDDENSLKMNERRVSKSHQKTDYKNTKLYFSCCIWNGPSFGTGINGSLYGSSKTTLVSKLDFISLGSAFIPRCLFSHPSWELSALYSGQLPFLLHSIKLGIHHSAAQWEKSAFLNTVD